MKGGDYVTNWLFIVIGLFLLVTLLNYISALRKSNNRIDEIANYLKLHSEHLKNLDNGKFVKEIANKIIFERVRISLLLGDASHTDTSEYINPEYIQERILKLNDELEYERINYEYLKNPTYAIQKTLALPAKFFNLIFPVNIIAFKNTLNFIFWVCTVLFPLILKVLKLIQ